MSRISHVSIDISEQSQIGIILLSLGGELFSTFKRFGISPCSEVGVGQVELYVVCVRISLERSLEVINRCVVHVIPGQQYANAGQSSKIGRTNFVDLHNRVLRLI